MRLALRSILAAGAALLAFAPAVHARTAETPALGPPKRVGVWAQTYSDLPAESDVRFGQLPNGLRYAILKNATPGGQASLRLRIGAGSLQETDEQQGLAHFLEHMAFKGSTHVPEGEMIRILQRKGLAFGPDTNAFTSFGQTVYELDLPETDADTVDTGLMLLRETASELTLSQKAMDSERGVILSEERLRDSPAYQAQKAELGFLLKGQRLPERWPIGLVDVIRTAPVSRIRAYYEANYRPDDATVIAVGDFDPAVMEAKIKARFGDWRPKPAPAPVDLGRVATRGLSAEVFSRPGAPQEVQLAWAQPYDDTADTLAREKRDYVEQLGLAVLNRRLDRLAKGPKPPFIAAQAVRSNTEKSAKLTTLSVDTTPQGWAAGLAAATTEQRRIVRFGVTAPELAREIAEQRASLGAQAAGAATRKTPELATALVSAVEEEDVFTGPVRNLATFEAAVRDLTPARADAVLKAAFDGSGPLLTLSSPLPVAGGGPALLAAYDAAARAPVTAGVAAAAKPWPYGGAAFGPAGRVVERREAADLGVVQVRFANGARLTVKPAAYAKDRVLVAVRFGAGRLGLPRDHASPLWALGAFTAGGTRELTSDELDQVLADKVVSARFALADEAFQLTGATRPADFDTQMRLLAAYVSRPGLRPEAFERWRAGVGSALPQIQSTPSGVEGRDIGRLTHAGDLRWTDIPTAQALAAAKPADLDAILAPALASGAPEITVVGDITVDQAIAAVSSTFGAFAPRPPAAPPADARRVRFPAATPEPVIELHDGRADQAIALIAWPTRGFYADPKEARVLDVAAQVLETRLVDQVRIAEGATYSPGANAVASQVYPGYGFVDAQVETPPAKIDGFYADVRKIAADMTRAAPTADELERAKKPLIETRLKQEQSDEFWLQRLARAWSDPRSLDAVRSQLPDLHAVTGEDVRRVAATYLAQPRAWRLIVRSPHPAPGSAQQAPLPVTPAPGRPAPGPDAPATPAAPNPAQPGTKTGAPSPTPAVPPAGGASRS